MEPFALDTSVIFSDHQYLRLLCAVTTFMMRSGFSDGHHEGPHIVSHEFMLPEPKIAVDRKTDAVFGWLLYVTLHHGYMVHVFGKTDMNQVPAKFSADLMRSHLYVPRCMTPPSWSNRSMEYRVYASS